MALNLQELLAVPRERGVCFRTSRLSVHHEDEFLFGLVPISAS